MSPYASYDTNMQIHWRGYKNKMKDETTQRTLSDLCTGEKSSRNKIP